MATSSATAYAASLACVSNAGSFIQDARVLIRNHSYGHAIALLVLAEEEIGKSVLWEMRAFGMPIDAKILKSQSAKQLLKVSTFDLWDLFIPDLMEGLKDVLQEPDEARQSEMMAGFVARFVPLLLGRLDQIPREKALTIAKRLLALDSKKQAGFYVDLRPDGTVGSPSDFTEEEAQRYLEFVEEKHRRFLEVSGTMPPPTEEGLQAARRLWEGNPLLKEKMTHFPALLERVRRKGLK